jgi:biopolymer transport protein ExbD
MMTFGPPRAPRRPSLTPMIDVVFLLLVFFMLAARFGHDLALPLATGSAGAVPYDGPPRLIGIAAEGITLNGRAVTLAALPGALEPLMEEKGDAVVLRPAPGADLQALISVTEALRAAGLTQLIVVE